MSAPHPVRTGERPAERPGTEGRHVSWAPRQSTWPPRPSERTQRHTRLASVPATDDDLDLVLEEISPGHAVFSTHARVMGRASGSLVNGGPCSTLLDFALGAAVTSGLPVGSTYRVLEFRVVNVSTRGRPEGVVRAVAHLLHPGVRGLWAGGRVYDGDGTLLAVGSLIAVVERGDRDQ